MPIAFNPGQIRYRVWQGLRHITRTPDASVDSALRALLRPPQWQLVARLGPADREHLLRVHQRLIRQGYLDQDLLLAALLHDVGKADQSMRVTILHRVIIVLLNRFAPGSLYSIAREDRGWFAHGLYLAVHHPALGSELAREAGASKRTCWLIAHHDDGTISGDEALRALQAIDAKE